MICFGDRFPTCKFLTACDTVSVSCIAFFLACSLFFISDLCLCMSCWCYRLFFSLFARLTCVFFDTIWLARSRLFHGSFIPVMSSWIDRFSCLYDLLTVLTISISAVAFLFTSRIFFIDQFCMLMTSCFDRFCVGFIAVFIGTVIGHLTWFGTCWFFCYCAIIPVMSF